MVDYNIGNALDRLQRYDEAIVASRAAAQAANRDDDARTYVHAMYAVGNHALQSEALEDARDAYIEALLRDPSDADAKYNLELVLRLLGVTPGQTPPGTPSVTPAAQPGSPTPAAGGDDGNGEGLPNASPTAAPGPPGAMGTPQPSATVAPGGTSAPGSQPADAGQGLGSLAEQLEELLADGVSPEEALAILDRLREESEASGLEPRVPDSGGLPDR